MGADAVLFIVAALDETSSRLHGLAGTLGMAALVEVHDEAELEPGARGRCPVRRGQPAGPAHLRGRPRARRASRRLHPAGMLKVAESGIESPADVAALASAGYDAVLVGETLLRANDRRAAAAALLAAVRAMWVKICGITSEEDALLAVAMGADAVGFVFAPSPRQMSPSAVQAIVRRLPPEICTVGVFRDERAEPSRRDRQPGRPQRRPAAREREPRGLRLCARSGCRW